MSRGSLVVVGTGMKVSNQCTIEAQFHIGDAEIVFESVGDVLAQKFVRSLNQNVVSLQTFYDRERPRDETYEMMVEAIMGALRSGKRVCAAFYGHPGVYVFVSHEAVRRARSEGFEAEMLPAVSADACLYADLGLDPAASGCQSFEATDFVINARKFDPTAALVLWQIAVVGDQTRRVFESHPARLAVLADVLMEDYPPEHIVTVYTAGTMPLARPQKDALPLKDLATAKVTQESTLYVPPNGAPRASPERLAMLARRLAAIET